MMSLRHFVDLEIHPLDGLEGLEPIHVNVDVMDEDVLAAVIRSDEPVTFFVEEFRDSSSSHVLALSDRQTVPIGQHSRTEQRCDVHTLTCGAMIAYGQAESSGLLRSGSRAR